MTSPDTALPGLSGWQRAHQLTRPDIGKIDLWLLACTEYQAHREALLNCLSTQEQHRAAAKKVPAKQFEYILGQAALRLLLAHALAIPSQEVRYARGHKGKPTLAPLHQRPDLYFNISHSCGLILIGLSMAGEIGVDLEGINHNTSIDLVSRRAFSASECQALQIQPEALRRQHFFQLWTCKEATVKCSGDGIHSGMSKFTVFIPTPDSAHIVAAHGPQAKTLDYSIAPLTLGNQHKGALVCAGEFQSLRRHYLTYLQF